MITTRSVPDACHSDPKRLRPTALSSASASALPPSPTACATSSAVCAARQPDGESTRSSATSALLSAATKRSSNAETATRCASHAVGIVYPVASSAACSRQKPPTKAVPRTSDIAHMPYLTERYAASASAPGGCARISQPSATTRLKRKNGSMSAAVLRSSTKYRWLPRAMHVPRNPQ